MSESDDDNLDDWTSSTQRYAGMNAGGGGETSSFVSNGPTNLDGHLSTFEVKPDRTPERLPDSPREVVLKEATDAVMRGRNNTYGPPTQDFNRAAEIASALGFRMVDANGGAKYLDSHHIAMLQIAVKLSRATWSPDHLDHWVDIAGYASCGYECVVEETR